MSDPSEPVKDSEKTEAAAGFEIAQETNGGRDKEGRGRRGAERAWKVEVGCRH